MKYSYSIVRSARKSVCVQISNENKISVLCPWSMPVKAVEEFLDTKEAWIEKIVLHNSKILAANDEVIEYRKIYVNGKTVPLIFGTDKKIGEDEVSITDKNDLFGLYKEFFQEKLTARVTELAMAAKLNSNDIIIKDYSGRWACCDAKNNLIFNYKLFMLSDDLQDYVIIHELCHTICRNHSPAFWRLVSEILPDYKQQNKKLRDFNFLTNLY